MSPLPSCDSIRSFLYVPGDRADRIKKALASDADAVLIDMEDAVSPTMKDIARDNVRTLLDDTNVDGCQVWVRVNAGDTGRADLAALLGRTTRLSGLVLAKCETVAWLDEVAAAIDDRVAVSPLIESAAAVRRIDALCAHPRVQQCHLGEIDLAADLGARLGGGEQLVDHARRELVYASAAAEILAPIGGVHADVRDQDALLRTSNQLADLGFNGRPAIHPTQIAAINAAFTPSAEETSDAARVVAEYERALASGVGAIADADGSMVDEAVVRRARRLLARADATANPRSETR